MVNWKGHGNICWTLHLLPHLILKQPIEVGNEWYSGFTEEKTEVEIKPTIAQRPDNKVGIQSQFQHLVLHQYSGRIVYSWSLNNMGVRSTNPHTVKSIYNVWLLQNLVVPWYQWGIGSWIPAQIPKSEDAQIPYIKWQISVHTVGFLHLWIENSTAIYWKKSSFKWACANTCSRVNCILINIIL